jgi:hypothetical protein
MIFGVTHRVSDISDVLEPLMDLLDVLAVVFVLEVVSYEHELHVTRQDVAVVRAPYAPSVVAGRTVLQPVTRRPFILPKADKFSLKNTDENKFCSVVLQLFVQVMNMNDENLSDLTELHQIKFKVHIVKKVLAIEMLIPF